MAITLATIRPTQNKYIPIFPNIFDIKRVLDLSFKSKLSELPLGLIFIVLSTLNPYTCLDMSLLSLED